MTVFENAHNMILTTESPRRPVGLSRGYDVMFLRQVQNNRRETNRTQVSMDARGPRASFDY